MLEPSVCSMELSMACSMSFSSLCMMCSSALASAPTYRSTFRVGAFVYTLSFAHFAPAPSVR